MKATACPNGAWGRGGCRRSQERPQVYSGHACAHPPVGCHTLPLGTFISVGRSLDSALDRVRLAEQLGYHSVYTTHVAGRDSLTLLAAYANVSQSIRIGTGVLPIYSRTPAATAQQAVTIDEISAGRLDLGIGVSHRVTVENWYGAEIRKPVAEMRDYVGVLRAILAARTRPSRRRSRRASTSSGSSRDPSCRSTLPACRRRCSSWPARSPTACSSGSATPTTSATWSSRTCARCRRKAGKDLAGFDITSPQSRPRSRTRWTAPARPCARNLAPYFLLPFYRKMIERSGYEST